MQNSVNQSTLLQTYIQQNKTVPNNSALSGIIAKNGIQPQIMPNQTDGDSFENSANNNNGDGSTKRTVAKFALGGAVILSAAAGIIAAFRHKGGAVKSFKSLFKKKPTVPKNIEGTGQKLKEQFENMGELQKGADNINNAKDSVVRHFLSKIPGFKRFDNWASNLYKKAAHKTLSKSYGKAFDITRASDDVILDAIKNNADPKSARLRELIEKRQNALKEFCDPENISKRMQELDKSMERLDVEAWEKIKKLRPKNIRGFAKKYSTTSLAEGRLKQSKKIQNELTEKFVNGGLNKKEAEEFSELIEILGKEKPEILKSSQRAQKAFKCAFTKEQTDLFEKLRDINYGAAPNDVLSIFETVGLLGLYTAQADTKEERVSVSLTTGIPLLASLGTTIVATSKMVSGAKALALGLATGAVANRIGKFVDKKYLESKGMDESPKTIITIDDYVNTIKQETKTILGQ